MLHDLFPVLVYEYNSKGGYGKPLQFDEASLEVWLRANLKRVLDEKRELRITDMMGLLCFHCVNGKIVYDGENHYPNGKPL